MKVKQRRSKVTVTDHPLHHFMLCSSSASLGIFFIVPLFLLGWDAVRICVFIL